MPFLSHEDLRVTRWTKTDVRKCLEAADVLGRVRSVALGANKGCNTGWMKHFKLYTALELVFVIIDHLHIEAGSEVGRSRNRCGANGMRLQTIKCGRSSYAAQTRGTDETRQEQENSESILLALRTSITTRSNQEKQLIECCLPALAFPSLSSTYQQRTKNHTLRKDKRTKLM